MLNIHDFSQETVNSITEVIEKSAMQEKKKRFSQIPRLSTKDSVRFFSGFVWIFLIYRILRIFS